MQSTERQEAVLLPNEIMDQVLECVWPEAAAVSLKEGAYPYLRDGLRQTLIHPDTDPRSAAKAIAVLRTIGDERNTKGDVEGAGQIASILAALAAAHHAEANALQALKRG